MYYITYTINKNKSFIFVMVIISYCVYTSVITQVTSQCLRYSIDNATLSENTRDIIL